MEEYLEIDLQNKQKRKNTWTDLQKVDEEDGRKEHLNKS